MARAIREEKRGSRKRNTHPVVIIVCEGAKTEPIYFNHFKKRDKPLRIEVVKDAAGESYRALIKAAIGAKEKYVNGTESNWAVWCVSDVDVDHNTPDNQSLRSSQLKAYAKEATQNGFRVALSNPCFELWFLLHFTYTTGHVRDCDTLIEKLSKYIPKYKKDSGIYNLLADKQCNAISNGKKLENYHQEQGKSDMIDVSVNPYTNVWELVEALI
ncbi:MAG: RloB family protein [Defluviitaleaceae bacterium]|nr:RloB family protein [Defluviitaleaceae bacterium]